MLSFDQLEHLVAVARYGTLSRAAAELHLSQPGLSRSMKRLEEELRVTLFERHKNRIELNENGRLALEYAERLLTQRQEMTERVRAADRGRRTISLGACTQLTNLSVSALLCRLYPQMTITSEIRGKAELLRGLQEHTYTLIAFDGSYEAEGVFVCPIYQEHLCFSLPTSHRLAKASALWFSDLDGENFLSREPAGLWREIIAQKMPNSHLLAQNEQRDFEQLVKDSQIPSFTSDIYSKWIFQSPDRVSVPILDPEATVSYFIACRAEDVQQLQSFFATIDDTRL